MKGTKKYIDSYDTMHIFFEIHCYYTRTVAPINKNERQMLKEVVVF
jgi:hypothetical protein